VNKTFNFLIIAAAVLGVACIFLITKYVDMRVTRAKESIPAQDIPTKSVLVAAEEISVGDDFNNFNVKTREMPENFVPSSAISDQSALEGKVALFTIPAEDMLLTSKVGEPNQLPKASTIIEEGKRLVTIGVDDQRASGFTIKNGDFVDLVGLFPVTEDLLKREDMPIGNTLGVTFLQRVKVFDIIYGEDAASEKEMNERDAETSSRRMARGTTATFMVSPTEAEVILAAENVAAEIYMVLRRYNDEEIRDQPSDLHARIIERLSGDLDQPAPPPSPVEAAPAPPKKLVF